MQHVAFVVRHVRQDKKKTPSVPDSHLEFMRLVLKWVFKCKAKHIGTMKTQCKFCGPQTAENFSLSVKPFAGVTRVNHLP